MSGGSFDYAYSKVEFFVDCLEVKLDQHDRVDRFGCTPNDYSPVVLDKLRQILLLSRYTAKLMREVEWLYSGDTSEESFMKRVQQIEQGWIG